MAEILPTILETDVVKALRQFIMGVVDPACEVLRTQVNRVPQPKGDCIYITPLLNTPLSTNVDTYVTGFKNILRGTQFNLQIDCYGSKCQEQATTISMLLRDDYGCRALAASGFDIQPLYATDPIQLPLITGEEQYLARWMFQAALQYNPVIQVAQQAATEITVGLIDVEVEYPVE
jgi:hypothetical protein